MEEWFQLVISCYPLSRLQGTEPLKLERSISSAERTLLLDLFRKQRNVTGVTNQLPVVQGLLSELMVISVGYCWKEFNEDDWSFLLSHLSCWIQSAVVMMEEFTENVNDTDADSSISNNSDSILMKFEQIVSNSDPSPIKNARNALLSFSVCRGLLGHYTVEDSDNLSSLRREKWGHIKDRIEEGILRIFFCTGISEAIASSYGLEAALIIVSSRLEHLSFWELVASSVLNSSPCIRERAVRSIEFWGLRKGAISALYAVLFSSKPIAPLQFAAYVILSTEPVSRLAIFREDAAFCLDEVSSVHQDPHSRDMPSEENIHLKDEISCLIEKLPYEVLDMDLDAQPRVNLLFIALSFVFSF